MKKNGGSLKEIFQEALNFYNKKDFKTSEIYCYKILSIDPNHFGSMSMLATLAGLSPILSMLRVMSILLHFIYPVNYSGSMRFMRSVTYQLQKRLEHQLFARLNMIV